MLLGIQVLHTANTGLLGLVPGVGILEQMRHRLAQCFRVRNTYHGTGFAEGPVFFIQAFEAVFAFDFRTYIEKKGFSGSGNLVTRRAVFDHIGGFRPGLSEDLDWCHRATAAGVGLVYAEELRVGHPARSDWPALARKWRRVNEETWGLRGRGAGARLRWGARALAMPLSALAHLPKVLRSDRLRPGTERARAAATLVRLRLARMAWMLAQALSAGR